MPSTRDYIYENSSKRPRRNFLVVQGFAIHRSDYRIVEALFSKPRKKSTPKFKIQKIVTTDGNDEDRRVTHLQVPSKYSSLYSFSPLPPSIGQFQSLKSLDFTGCHMANLPEEIGNLTTLRELNLERTRIRSIPPSIGLLKNLERLDMSWSQSSSLPEEIGGLSSLRFLYLGCSRLLGSLPHSIGQLQNLEELRLNGTYRLSNIPEEIGGLISLTNLDLSCSKMMHLPEGIGGLVSLKKIDISLSSSPAH